MDKGVLQSEGLVSAIRYFGFLFEAVWKDIVREAEGEHFITRLGNPAQFIIFKMGRTRPLVGAVGLVEFLRLPPSPTIIVVDAHKHIYI